jgi:uncharacterized protein (TIGR02271 family)
VRTDRERIEVPTCHEEVSVERVPVEGEATRAQIGEDEVVVPVTEEEVVVGKRAVVKEEVRIRKDVVEDTEVVEEDVRREEIDVEGDQASRPLKHATSPRGQEHVRRGAERRSRRRPAFPLHRYLARRKGSVTTWEG